MIIKMIADQLVRMPHKFHVVYLLKKDSVPCDASIVKMPRGVPLVTVVIENATNAGLLAVRCLWK